MRGGKSFTSRAMSGALPLTATRRNLPKRQRALALTYVHGMTPRPDYSAVNFNLIPGVGDILTLAPSAWIIIEAKRMGASPHVIGRMAANTATDTLSA